MRRAARAFLFAATALASACNMESAAPEHLIADEDRAARSPSGRYLLDFVPAGGDDLRIRVRDATGQPTSLSTLRFDRRHRTFASWDEAGRVWVYSGDIGIYYGEPSDVRNLTALRGGVDGQPAPPPNMKEKLPHLHPP